MYKNIFIVIVVFLFVGCGTVGSISSDYDSTSDEMEKMANELTDNGGVAVVGEAQEARKDLARRSAELSGRVKIAEAIELKVSSLTKKAIESIGQGDINNEINSAFTDAGKTSANQILKGVRTKKSKVIENKNSFAAFALVIIDPKIVNNAIFDEIKVNKPKTYERIRTSQLFDELKEEEKKYETKAKELNVE